MAQAALFAAQMGDGVARSSLGDSYGRTRSTATWGYSALVSFVPIIQPAVIPFQVAMMIGFLITYWLIIGFGFVNSVIAAYFTQAIITMITVHFLADTVASILVGRA